MSAIKSYLRTYFWLLVPSLFAVAGFNLIVDYQNIYRLVNIAGFNQEKQLIHKTTMRPSKSVDLARGDYDTLILGNSKALLKIGYTRKKNLRLYLLLSVSFLKQFQIAFLLLSS